MTVDAVGASSGSRRIFGPEGWGWIAATAGDIAVIVLTAVGTALPSETGTARYNA